MVKALVNTNGPQTGYQVNEDAVIAAVKQEPWSGSHYIARELELYQLKHFLTSNWTHTTTSRNVHLFQDNGPLYLLYMYLQGKNNLISHTLQLKKYTSQDMNLTTFFTYPFNKDSHYKEFMH
jgi:hypothetical protein